jgi:hypothetical protein
MYSCINRKVREHILVTPLGNRSSPAMAHYGMGIYDNNTIMPSIYANPEVRYTNYFPTSHAYNTNVVDRSHVTMPASSSHVNMHNSYSINDMSRESNHNAYIFEHVSNIHNGFVPPYSLTEPASHCTSQIHMLMSNYYSRTDLRTLAGFDQSLYITPDSIRIEIAPNMVSAPPVVSSAFHSASPIYSRVEECSTNTPAPSTNMSHFDKGFDTELTIEDLPVEYRRELKAIHLKLEEAFMVHYDVTSQGLVLRDTVSFVFDISKVIPDVEITAEQTNSLDDVRSGDYISVLPGNRSASIWGLYPTANSKVKSQHSDDMHNLKTSVADDHREDSVSNVGLRKRSAILLPTLIWPNNKLVLRLVSTR